MRSTALKKKFGKYRRSAMPWPGCSITRSPSATPCWHRTVGGGPRRCALCAAFWLDPERYPVELAIPAGFEPAPHGVEIRYSIQLSYGTVLALIAPPV